MEHSVYPLCHLDQNSPPLVCLSVFSMECFSSSCLLCLFLSKCPFLISYCFHSPGWSCLLISPGICHLVGCLNLALKLRLLLFLRLCGHLSAVHVCTSLLQALQTLKTQKEKLLLTAHTLLYFPSNVFTRSPSSR